MVGYWNDDERSLEGLAMSHAPMGWEEKEPYTPVTQYIKEYLQEQRDALYMPSRSYPSSPRSPRDWYFEGYAYSYDGRLDERPDGRLDERPDTYLFTSDESDAEEDADSSIEATSDVEGVEEPKTAAAMEAVVENEVYKRFSYL